ncbi:MFS transporter [Achromobacter piechaudii]|nr:MFS transporter [Achromobacter piechaudii]
MTLPAYQVSPAMRRRVVIASVLGNAFEWFDFAIYGMFAAVISRLYFPTGDNATSLLLGLATFGVAFAVRPIGGLVLGIYADRHGRRRALSLMILMMAGGTAMIGVLPTYASIGVAASVLMLVARLIQGFSVGGEYASASAMLVEFAPPGRRGRVRQFPDVLASLGVFCRRGRRLPAVVQSGDGRSGKLGVAGAVPVRHADRPHRLLPAHASR